jgi:hypothetical protein
MEGFGNIFGFWNFWGNFWRRGAHVNIPELGSRGAEKCLEEFWGVYAVLRRKFDWGNFTLGFFGVLVGCPRRSGEEGGQLVFPRVFWGLIGWFYWGTPVVLGWT